MSDSRPLTKREEAGVAAVRFVERKVIRRMRRLVEHGALNATRINDDGLDDQGSEVLLNEQEKRIAMDLRKSKRHAPVYLDVHLRRVEAAEKADALRDQPKTNLNIGVFVEVRAPEYPTLRIDTKATE